MCNDVVCSGKAGVRGQGFGQDGGLWHVHVKASIKMENMSKFNPHLHCNTELALDVAVIGVCDRTCILLVLREPHKWWMLKQKTIISSGSPCWPPVLPCASSTLPR